MATRILCPGLSLLAPWEARGQKGERTEGLEAQRPCTQQVTVPRALSRALFEREGNAHIPRAGCAAAKALLSYTSLCPPINLLLIVRPKLVRLPGKELFLLFVQIRQLRDGVGMAL